jgi:hypothetical protein
MDWTTAGVGLGTLLLLGAATCGTSRADDFPLRKAGLWEVDMTMSGGKMPPQQMKMCIDPATDAEMYQLGMNAAQGMCSKPDIHRSGGTVTISTTCKMGESKISTQSVTKFTGDTAYHTDVNSTFDPPMGTLRESAVTQDAKWSGACPADMQPGDVLMANGIKMNIKQMLGGKQ